MKKPTPLMQQYHTIKSDYPDFLVFFQVGDFFELFFDDAKNASAFLGIALTKRGKDKGEDIPLCGVPVHALDHHLTKLVKGGFCVVICEQLEPPRPGTIVKRGVTKVLTPGTLTDEKLLDDKSASYVMSFVSVNNKWALLFGELLTAQLYATTFEAGSSKILEAELARFFPDEVLLTDDDIGNTFAKLFKKQGYFVSSITPSDDMNQWAQKQLQPTICESITTNKALEKALSTFHAYLKKNNEAALSEFTQLHLYSPDDFMVLDPATQRNLELVKNNQDGGRSNTLFALLDTATTAMGSRTLKKWLVRPLLNKKMIDHRLDAVQLLKSDNALLRQTQTALRSIGDAERIIGRIALGRGTLHDYVHLQRTLEVAPEIKKTVKNTVALLHTLSNNIGDFTELYTFLCSALNTDSIKDWIIKTGFNGQLDRYRDLVNNSQQSILALEKQEQAATGINSLKIRYNSVQGYYIEVTKANLHLVPDRYVRRQTLVGKERYTYPQLQELQHEIMTARGQCDQLEHELFDQVKQKVRPHVGQLRKMAHALGQLDALLALGICAYERGYTRPQLSDSRDIIITEGKHPVIEQKLGSSFIPNNTNLTDEQSLWVITGPNMGGKSTYLRQVAQLSIMAQCGSFIPVQSAQLPLLDRIFTRIGASDNVAEGKSTFLVEMEETAHICQYATQNSLVILDEVGRGTSTFDGLAIAQAVIEYLYTHVKARCLFATHYHELTTLQEQFTGITSYYAASKKTNEGIVFLHKIERGVADGSFGLDVAHLAHLPEVVITRARQVVQELSMQNTPERVASSIPSHPEWREQSERCIEGSKDNSELLKLRSEITNLKKQLDGLKSLDFDNLSPKKAFDLLWQFKD
ncbi:MAG: DNA mismatch repair protein MutS [Alteromonas naphthalenivorans]|jgi:DNA mismatch repair protein MutS